VPNGKHDLARRHITSGHQLTRIGSSANEGSQARCSTLNLSSRSWTAVVVRYHFIFQSKFVACFRGLWFPCCLSCVCTMFPCLIVVKLPLCTANRFVLHHPHSVFPSIAPGESRFHLILYKSVTKLGVYTVYLRDSEKYSKAGFLRGLTTVQSASHLKLQA
jgi:hypothetical protein